MWGISFRAFLVLFIVWLFGDLLTEVSRPLLALASLLSIAIVELCYHSYHQLQMRRKIQEWSRQPEAHIVVGDRNYTFRY